MTYNYLYAVLLGLLYYPLQQLLFFVRFGSFNAQTGLIDLVFPVTGILAFMMLFYVLNMTKQKNAQLFFWAIFILFALPTSLMGVLGGGLLGPVGSVAFGLVPVFVVLLLGKGITKLVWK